MAAILQYESVKSRLDSLLEERESEKEKFQVFKSVKCSRVKVVIQCFRATPCDDDHLS